jgi:hypothetical protein
MSNTRAVDLRVDLPAEIADQVEEVQRRDPEMLGRMVHYLMLRKTVFGLLSERCRHDTRYGAQSDGTF